jgi:hypothetical protein
MIFSENLLLANHGAVLVYVYVMLDEIPESAFVCACEFGFVFH